MKPGDRHCSRRPVPANNGGTGPWFFETWLWVKTLFLDGNTQMVVVTIKNGYYMVITWLLPQPVGYLVIAWLLPQPVGYYMIITWYM